MSGASSAVSYALPDATASNSGIFRNFWTWNEIQ